MNDNTLSTVPHDRLRHRLAIAMMCLTASLVFVGGSVTSNDAGMAVLDWPTTNGENMITYHPRHWVNGEDIFFEHSHRLLGAFVGVVMIALALLTQVRDNRTAVRVLGWAMLAGVIAQGVMGGYRVLNDSINLAVIHGCFAHLFFSSTVLMVMLTSRIWQSNPGPQGFSPGLRRFSVISAATVYGQIIAGAIYRHFGHSLAYHVIGACLATLVISGMVLWISGQYHERPLHLRLTKWLGGFLMLQLMLGVAAYVSILEYDAARNATFVEWFVPSLHVVIGSGILGLSVGLVVSIFREPAKSPAASSVGIEGATAA